MASVIIREVMEMKNLIGKKFKKNFEKRLVVFGIILLFMCSTVMANANLTTGNIRVKPTFDTVLDVSKNSRPYSVENWWDPNWSYYKEITINHLYVDADLINYPILFYNTSNDFASHAQPDGDDFVFMSEDNSTQYNHEIEYYNSTTGELIVWVNITYLSPSVDTVVYLYYGNPSCGSQENVAGTWDSHYIMVQHMDDATPSTITDSTSYDNDGTKVSANNPAQAVGKIGYGQTYNRNDEDIDCGKKPSTNIHDAVTLEAWVNTDANNIGAQGIVDRLDTWSAGYALYIYGNSLSFNVVTTSGRKPLYHSNNVNPNTWYYAAGRYNSSTGAIEVWQDLNTVSSTHTGTILDANDPVTIGKRSHSDLHEFDGEIDEVRISNISRSDSWINTTFNTINSPSTFLYVGSEKTSEEDDFEPPNIIITQPTPGAIYFWNMRIFIYFIATVIIGPVEITVFASDNLSGVDRVEFYIDDEYMDEDSNAPYKWLWNERVFFFMYEIKVIAYDNAGNQDHVTLGVWKVL